MPPRACPAFAADELLCDEVDEPELMDMEDDDAPDDTIVMATAGAVSVPRWKDEWPPFANSTAPSHAIFFGGDGRTRWRGW